MVKTHRRIDLLSFESRDIDFIETLSILREPDLIRRRAACHVYRVALAHHGYDSSGIGPNTVAYDNV